MWGDDPAGARRLWALLRALPPEAAVWRETAPESAGWDLHAQLLASMVEFQQADYLAFLQANSKKGARVPKLQRIPRPGVASEQPRQGQRVIDPFSGAANLSGSATGEVN